MVQCGVDSKATSAHFGTFPCIKMHNVDQEYRCHQSQWISGNFPHVKFRFCMAALTQWIPVRQQSCHIHKNLLPACRPFEIKVAARQLIKAVVIVTLCGVAVLGRQRDFSELQLSFSAFLSYTGGQSRVGSTLHIAESDPVPARDFVKFISTPFLHYQQTN